MSFRRRLFELGLTLSLVGCQPLDVPNTYTQSTQKPEISNAIPSPTYSIESRIQTPVATSHTTPRPTPVPTIIRTPPTVLNTQTPQPNPPPTVKQTPSPPKLPIVYVSGICDGNPRNTFSEITAWLVRDEKYTASDFYYYNYETGGNSGESFDILETMKSIDGRGGSAENFRNFILRYFPYSKVDVRAHSLGGVVALYALSQYPELKDRIRSVVTIDSPLHGIEWVKNVLSQAYPCVDLYEIKNMDWDQVKNINIDPKKIDINNIRNIDLSQIKTILPPAILDMQEKSSVISRITGVDYRKVFAEGGPYVETIANTGDFFCGTPSYRTGTNCTLTTAYGNGTYTFSLPAALPSRQVLSRHGEFINPVLYAHGIPLQVVTMEEVVDDRGAYFMRDGALFVQNSLRSAISSRK